MKDILSINTGTQYIIGNLLIFSGIFGSYFYNTVFKKIANDYTEMEMLFYTYIFMVVMLLPFLWYSHGTGSSHGQYIRIGTKRCLIAINIIENSITLIVSDIELQQRKHQLKPFATPHKRGHPALCKREVLQANKCCDFDFLKPKNAYELIFIDIIVGRS